MRILINYDRFYICLEYTFSEEMVTDAREENGTARRDCSSKLQAILKRRTGSYSGRAHYSPSTDI